MGPLGPTTSAPTWFHAEYAEGIELVVGIKEVVGDVDGLDENVGKEEGLKEGYNEVDGTEESLFEGKWDGTIEDEGIEEGGTDETEGPTEGKKERIEELSEQHPKMLQRNLSIRHLIKPKTKRFLECAFPALLCP